jgi:glycosyltransferase involved in cell wall biosynthesis
VDEGSRDSSVDIAHRMLESQKAVYWRVVELGCNRGVSAVRNAGIDASRSRFLAFLDTDDYFGCR